jgi:hypothetical protein
MKLYAMSTLAAPSQEEDRRRLKELSDARIQNWPNTVQAIRKKKEAERFEKFKKDEVRLLSSLRVLKTKFSWKGESSNKMRPSSKGQKKENYWTAAKNRSGTASTGSRPSTPSY